MSLGENHEAESVRVLLIAIADDNRHLITRRIREFDPTIELHTADSLREATQRIQAEAFDCILVDYRLPDGYGLDLLKDTGLIPVVMLTALADEAVVRTALKEGAQDYLFKDQVHGPTLVRSIRYAIERKRAAELRGKLKHAERLGALGQLAAGVAHEINNPAAIISANNTVLIEGLNELRGLLGLVSPDVKEKLNELQEMIADNASGVERIVRVVRKLHSFSKLEHGQNEEVDLNHVIRSVCALLDNKIRFHAQLTLDLAESLPTLMAGQGELDQVVTNVIVNSLQAIEGGEAQKHKIRISTRLSGQVIRMEIEDSGRGISKESQERVFEPFFTTNPTEGAGLGLAISSEIVQKMRGKIELVSEVGKGTLVTIALPLEIATGDLPVEELPTKPERSFQRAALNILIVDDEEMLLRAYARALKKERLVMLKSGQSALGLIRDGARFDGILCDLMMPDLDGQAFYEAVGQVAPEMLSKLVFCTGGAFTRKMQHFVNQPDVKVLEKPVSSLALKEVLSKWAEES